MDILAFLAFAVLTTLEPCLIALTILFEAVRFFAVATFNVFVCSYFLSERIWVPVHESHDCIASFFRIDLKIVTTYTVTPITSLVQSKAITIEFEAFRLLALADNFLSRSAILVGAYVSSGFKSSWSLSFPSSMCLQMSLSLYLYIIFRGLLKIFRRIFRFLMVTFIFRLFRTVHLTRIVWKIFS
jgi:hypothetical protein